MRFGELSCSLALAVALIILLYLQKQSQSLQGSIDEARAESQRELLQEREARQEYVHRRLDTAGSCYVLNFVVLVRRSVREIQTTQTQAAQDSEQARKELQEIMEQQLRSYQEVRLCCRSQCGHTGLSMAVLLLQATTVLLEKQQNEQQTQHKKLSNLVDESHVRRPVVLDDSRRRDAHRNHPRFCALLQTGIKQEIQALQGQVTENQGSNAAERQSKILVLIVCLLARFAS